MVLGPQMILDGALSAVMSETKASPALWTNWFLTAASESRPDHKVRQFSTTREWAVAKLLETPAIRGLPEAVEVCMDCRGLGRSGLNSCSKTFLQWAFAYKQGQRNPIQAILQLQPCQIQLGPD